MAYLWTRRQFGWSALAAVGCLHTQAQTPAADELHTSAIAAAETALALPVVALFGVGEHPASPLHASFEHAFAGADDIPDNAPLRHFGATVCALATGFAISRNSRFAARAAEHWKASLFATDFAAPASGLQRPYEFTTLSSPSAILGLVPLAELTRSLAFLADAEAMPPALQSVLRKNFSAILQNLRTQELPALARDAHDHRASAWLLVASALSRATGNSLETDRCRLLFTKPTLRNQMAADGHFPQEVATANPYRNSLMNFDLLAACAQLLTTPFDSPWNDELADGPGMRAATAYLAPYIADRSRWPFSADATHFHDLPGRRAGMLFAGHAFHRPEYAAAYSDAPNTAPPEEIAYSYPITQPLLWTMRPPHGL